MNNSIIITIIISLIYACLAIDADTNIRYEDSSDINFFNDIYDTYDDTASFIQKENDLFSYLDKRGPKKTKVKTVKKIKVKGKNKEENKDEKNNVEAEIEMDDDDDDEDNNYDVKVSVIIPSYNSEKLIGRCIESALNQTLKAIEIIVVDDCSKDATRSIVDGYKEKDDRIKTIYKSRNSGVGSSRNLALEEAVGQFIGFIDADDYVDPGWFQNLYDNSKNMDLVRGIRVLHNFSETYRKSRAKPYGCIVPSIIRKSFLDKHHLRFPRIRKFEDSNFNRELKSKNPRTNLLPDNGIYYHYVKREGSLSNYINPNKNDTTTTITTTTTTTTTKPIESTSNTEVITSITEEDNKKEVNVIENPSFAKYLLHGTMLISGILILGTSGFLWKKKKDSKEEKLNLDEIEEANEELLKSKEEEDSTENV